MGFPLIKGPVAHRLFYKFGPVLSILTFITTFVLLCNVELLYRNSKVHEHGFLQGFMVDTMTYEDVKKVERILDWLQEECDEAKAVRHFGCQNDVDLGPQSQRVDGSGALSHHTAGRNDKDDKQKQLDQNDKLYCEHGPFNQHNVADVTEFFDASTGTRQLQQQQQQYRRHYPHPPVYPYSTNLYLRLFEHMIIVGHVSRRWLRLNVVEKFHLFVSSLPVSSLNNNNNNDSVVSWLHVFNMRLKKWRLHYKTCVDYWTRFTSTLASFGLNAANFNRLLDFVGFPCLSDIGPLFGAGGSKKNLGPFSTWSSTPHKATPWLFEMLGSRLSENHRVQVSYGYFRYIFNNGESQVGSSLLAHIKCWRCHPVSSILVVATVDLRRPCSNLVSTCVGAALVEYFAKVSTLCQNLNILFVDSGLPMATAVRQYLLDYYQDPSFNMRTGSIMSALVIDLRTNSPTCKSVEIKYQGTDGRVPCQDVFNVLVEDAYDQKLSTFSRSFWTSAFRMAVNAGASDPHVPLIQGNINAFGITCKNPTSLADTLQGLVTPGKYNLDSLVRTLGLTIRGLNNLDTAMERAPTRYLLVDPSTHIPQDHFGPITTVYIVSPLALALTNKVASGFENAIKGLGSVLLVGLATSVPSYTFLSILASRVELLRGPPPPWILRGSLVVALLCYVYARKFIRRLHGTDVLYFPEGVGDKKKGGDDDDAPDSNDCEIVAKSELAVCWRRLKVALDGPSSLKKKLEKVEVLQNLLLRLWYRRELRLEDLLDEEDWKQLAVVRSSASSSNGGTTTTATADASAAALNGGVTTEGNDHDPTSGGAGAGAGAGAAANVAIANVETDAFANPKTGAVNPTPIEGTGTATATATKGTGVKRLFAKLLRQSGKRGADVTLQTSTLASDSIPAPYDGVKGNCVSHWNFSMAKDAGTDNKNKGAGADSQKAAAEKLQTPPVEKPQAESIYAIDATPKEIEMLARLKLSRLEAQIDSMGVAWCLYKNDDLTASYEATFVLGATWAICALFLSVVEINWPLAALVAVPTVPLLLLQVGVYIRGWKFPTFVTTPNYFNALPEKDGDKYNLQEAYEYPLFDKVPRLICWLCIVSILAPRLLSRLADMDIGGGLAKEMLAFGSVVDILSHQYRLLKLVGSTSFGVLWFIALPAGLLVTLGP